MILKLPNRFSVVRSWLQFSKRTKWQKQTKNIKMYTNSHRTIWMCLCRKQNVILREIKQIINSFQRLVRSSCFVSTSTIKTVTKTVKLWGSCRIQRYSWGKCVWKHTGAIMWLHLAAATISEISPLLGGTSGTINIDRPPWWKTTPTLLDALKATSSPIAFSQNNVLYFFFFLHVCVYQTVMRKIND